MESPIKIYNSLSQTKELLTPLIPGHVRMYACGVTVYDDCHIGHAMQAVFFDVMTRFFKYMGYHVTYVRNYTDVDDKIIDRAESLGIPPFALAEAMIASCDEDMDSLDICGLDHKPKVSESIPEILDMVAELILQDYAYVTPVGDVYYRVRKKQDYGKLSNRCVDELQSGTRTIVHGAKQDDLDFVLWKADQTEGASWDSPWGRGRPGWHIECSAMTKRYFGPSFDIHGGGRDLLFPHHENEIAQSEAANQAPYASLWVHSGLLTLNKQKMSKSLGNSIRIKAFVKEWDGEVLRFCYIQNHYRSNIDFSEDIFRGGRKKLLYFYQTLKQAYEALGGLASPPSDPPALELVEHKKKFIQAMSDDFNTPKAMAELHMLARKLNKLLGSWPHSPSPVQIGFLVDGVSLLKELAQSLGLLTKVPSEFIQTLEDKILPEMGLNRLYIDQQVALRNTARQQKLWAESDRIRISLQGQGICLKDHPTGTSFSLMGLD